ncbi:MAG: hypothetical protein WAV41_02255 [Microgenomates group bacterium]
MVMDKIVGVGKIIWGDKVDKIINLPVPYKNGNNCIFFAIQDAFSHLIAPGGFGEDEFKRFRRGLDDFVNFEKELVGGAEGAPGQGLAMTLLFLVPYLHEKLIDVRAIHTNTSTVQNVKKIYKELEELPFVEVNSETGFKPPFLVLSYHAGVEGSHLFYVHDVEDYKEKVKVHMNEGDKIGAIICVERTKNQ